MADRRGSRFVAEALFLVALAVALALARLDALAIAGAMLLGWLLVAALEWAAWRAEPHFGSGLPPRYYVPAVKLPPPQPLEQVGQGYPDASREEAPTWIASAALRAEALGEWPVAAAPVEVEPEPAEAVAGSEEEALEPPSEAGADRGRDPWTITESPSVPLGEAPATSGTAPKPPARLPPAGAPTTARYRFDPLAEPHAGRRFRRQRQEDDDGESLRVPARVTGPRPLPEKGRS
jgi:hypothetical protein